jgi:hypothetical protein
MRDRTTGEDHVRFDRSVERAVTYLDWAVSCLQVGQFAKAVAHIEQALEFSKSLAAKKEADHVRKNKEA